MLTVEALRNYGANVEEGLTRCMGNEAFYLKLVKMVADSPASFDALAAAMEAGDTRAAFEAAHALKGAMGNVALTPIAKPAAQLSDMLKQAPDMPLGPECQALAREVLEQYEKLKAL